MNPRRTARLRKISPALASCFANPIFSSAKMSVGIEICAFRARPGSPLSPWYHIRPMGAAGGVAVSRKKYKSLLLRGAARNCGFPHSSSNLAPFAMPCPLCCFSRDRGVFHDCFLGSNDCLCFFLGSGRLKTSCTGVYISFFVIKLMIEA